MTAHADLAEVRAALALVAKATPGPWRTFGRWPNLAVVSGSGRPRIVASLASASDAVDDTPEDAAAIVALRNAAPAIAAAVEELTAARAEIARQRETIRAGADAVRSANASTTEIGGRLDAAGERIAALEADVAKRDAEIAALRDLAGEAIETASEAPDGGDQVADYRERLASLNRQICRLVSGQEIDGDHLCQHHGADVAALAQVARYQAAAVAVATEIGGPLGPVDDDPEERAAAFVRFAESLPGRVRERIAPPGPVLPPHLDTSCPAEGCGGQVEGGEFFDGSTSRCTRCGADVVCVEVMAGTFCWETEEDDDE